MRAADLEGFAPVPKRPLVDRLKDCRLGTPICGEAADEIERLLRVEADHKNVLKAALYDEPDGIDLVRRLTTYAVAQREPATSTRSVGETVNTNPALSKENSNG